MNGADFVKKILNHPKGGIEKLISLGKDTECDWLEFKASLNPKDPPKGKESRAERQSRYWHVVRAIISMQNSQGGAVILGIDDSGKAVGLGASDPENRLEQGTDTFALRSLDPAFRPESFEWITEKRRYKINQKVYSQLFEYSFWDYEDKPILVIIVHPYQTRSNTPILVQETLVNVSNTEREVLLFRQKGDVGKTETLWRFSDIENYSRQNSLSNKFNLLHDAFIHSLTIPFFPAIKSTEKVVKKAQSASFRCIGIDWKHFLDAILPTISACAEIPNYTLEFQVFLIDPNSPDNTPHLADSKEASQRSLGRLEKIKRELTKRYIKNRGRLIIKTGLYSELPVVHGWCIETSSKHYYVSDFSHTDDEMVGSFRSVDWNPDRYIERTVQNESLSNDPKVVLFEQMWSQLLSSYKLTEN